MTTAAQSRSDAGLATALRISVSRLARRLRVERIAQGSIHQVLSDTQLAALAALERHATMSPGELAEHEKVQPPSMTRVIAALEERNLVTRMPHPTDRRQVVLTVTVEGRELVHQARRLREAWLARRLQELTPQERATLRAGAPILEQLSPSGAPRRPPATGCSRRCTRATTGCSRLGRSSPTPAAGCSASRRTGWCSSSPTTAAPRWALPPACSSCRCSSACTAGWSPTATPSAAS